MRSAPSEPELPDRVPEKRDAVTPDLPPFGPAAPDLPGVAGGRRRHDGPGEEGEEAGKEEGEEGGGSEADKQPPSGPGNAPPQEPTG